MNPDTIDCLVQEKYDSILKVAVKEAEEDFNQDFLPILIGKTNFEKAALTYDEIESIFYKLKKAEVPSYFYYDSELDATLRLFANRSLLLNVDDSEALHTGIYFGKKLILFSDLYDELTENLPPYSYKDFARGKNDPFFLELDVNNHVLFHDDDVIREWQKKHLIKIVSLESSIVIKNIQKECRSASAPLDIINFNVKIINHVFNQEHFSSPDELIKRLKEITFLKDYDSGLLNDNGLLREFYNFKNQKLIFSKVSPGLYSEIQNIFSKKRPVHAFSPVPVIFYTIKKVFLWMEKVLEGENVFAPIKEEDLSKLYSKTKHQALKLAQSEIDRMEQNFSEDKLEKIKPGKLYASINESLMIEYFAHPFVMQYIVSGHNDRQAKSYFIFNSFFSNDIYKQVLELQRALEFCAKVSHNFEEYVSFVGTQDLAKYEDVSISYFVLGLLMYDMVLDSELFLQYWDIDDDLSNIERYAYLPTEFVKLIQDYYEQKLFYSWTGRLANILNSCPITNKSLFVHTRLKQLKIDDFNMKGYLGKDISKEDDKFSLPFKEFLEIEANYIKEIKDLMPPTVRKAGNVNIDTTKPNSKLSFAFKEKDSSKLTKVINDLCLKQDMLKDPASTAEDLIQVLLANDLTTIKKPIHLNCQTTQFVYIFNALSPHFRSLNAITIDRSKLFYSKNGKLLNAQNMYSNKRDYINKKAEIDKILNQLQ